MIPKGCITKVFALLLGAGLVCPLKDLFSTPLKQEYTIGQVDPSLYLYPIVADWYQRIGTKVRYLPMPMERSAMEADSGRVDAELSGGSTIPKRYKNLRKIPTSLTTVDISMFSIKHASIKPQEIFRYKVAAPIGYEFLDYSIKGFKDHVLFLVKPIQVAGMLFEGRVDVAISENSTMLKALLDYKKNAKSRQFPKIQLLPKPLAQVELFHWVHKSNAPIIPFLNQELIKIKKERVIELAKEKYTLDLLNFLNRR